MKSLSDIVADGFAGGVSAFQSGGSSVIGLLSTLLGTVSSTVLMLVNTTRDIVGQVSPDGTSYPFQPSLYATKVGFFTPLGNGTVTTVIGLAITANGTATARNVANTPLLASLKRIGYASAATVGSAAGIRAVPQYWRGNAAGLGGFFLSARVAVSASQLTMRAFVGMHSSAAAIAGTVEPSTLLNMIGVGFDSTDLNWQIMYNDGSGVATKVNTGIAYALNQVIEVQVYCAPNSSTMKVSIEVLNTTTKFQATPSTDLPVNSTFPAPHVHLATTLLSAVAIDVVSLYIDTPF